MLFLKKTLFGLIVALLLIVGINSTVDAGFTKQIVGGTQYQNNGLVQYVVAYTNTGIATEVVRLVDILPASLMGIPGATSFCNGIPSPGSSFTVSVAGNSYATNFCTIQPGESATMTISALIIDQDFTTISNSASVEQYSGGIFVSSESASADFSAYPLLSIDKVFIGPSPQQLNDLVTFTIVIANSGSTAANNIVLVDSMPNGFVYNSSTLGVPTIDLVNNTATWTIPTIPANTTVTYTVVIQLATSIPGAGLSVGSLPVNTGSILTGSLSTPGYIEFSDDNFDAVDFAIAGIPFVTLTKNLIYPANSTISLSGDVVGYSITVTNTGTDIATGDIIDVLPSELTGFTSSLPPSLVNGYTWTWTGVSLNPGDSLTIYLTGVLPNIYLSSSVFTNAAVFVNTGLPGSVLNNGTATGLILGVPNVQLDKTILGYSTGGASGDSVVYQITLTNTSSTLYTGTRCVIDSYPQYLQIISSSTPQTPCGTAGTSQYSFSGTGLPATIVLTGIFNSDVSSGTVITNTAEVFVNSPELFTGDNIDQVSFTISNPDLSIQKIANASTYTGVSGTPILYTINYSNNGGADASGIMINDILPNMLIYSGMVSGPSPIISGQSLIRNVPSLSPNQSNSLSFYVILSGYFQGIITNTGSISMLGNEINLTNNASAISVNVVAPPADLSINKIVQTQGTYLSGSQYTFLLNVVNNGGQTATGVIISDTFPSILTYLTGFSTLINTTGNNLSWNVVGNTLTTDDFVLSPGQTGSVVLTMQLNNNILTGSTYTNTGSIISSAQEVVQNNNISTVDFNIIPPIFSCSGVTYSLSLVSPLQNPTGFSTLSGQSVQYTYSITNNYNIPLELVSINTVWPSQVSTPIGLVGGNVVSNTILPSLSGVNFILTGSTIVDGITNITTPADFTLRVPGGQPFTCNTNSSLAISQTCGNGFINSNLGEQCENYNGGVVVGFGQTFDPNSQICNSTCRLQTTRVVNCASMTVNGVQDISCVTLDAQPELPVLAIDKRVNGQKTIASSINSVVTYSISIRNTSAYTAYNVTMGDLFPWNQMEYLGPISITPSSYNTNLFTINTGVQLFSGNIGNIAPGVEVVITFPARVIVNSFNAINNIVNINYTNNNNVPQPQLTSNAIINQSGSVVCGNGVRDTNEQCDLGSLPGIIANYLDLTTNFPSNSNQGSLCTSTCQISNVASRCGDGIVGRLEQCDLGNNSNIYNGGIIGSYLDAIGQSLPSGIYASRSCTSSCIIDSPDAPAAPACRYTDTVISVMKDEIFPFSRDVELGKGRIITNENQCNTSNAGALIEDSLECVFEIYNKNEEATNGLSLRRQVSYGCKVDQWADYKLFKPLYGTENALFAEKPRGTYKITLDNSILNGSYGEYKLSLEKVNYKYCDGNGRVVQGNPYARVCQVNFAVTDHYLMQKGSVSNTTNSDLSRYYMLDGADIYRGTDLDKVNKISSLNITNLSSAMKTLTNNLIAKYEKIAVSATLSDNEVKKVPGKSIYIMNGGKTFRGADLSTPTTIIVKGDVNIEGNISNNVLLIATGKVRFTLPTPDQWVDSCTTQVINGIVVAQGGFASTPNNGYKNTNLNNPRCRKGNLQVYGVLVGNNLDDLVNSRRSHLEHWFTFRRNGSTITVNDSDIKAERRDEIYKGASVYIEQNPSLWRSMPPGADEFLKILNVSRS